MAVRDFPDENFNNAINKIHSLSTKSVTFYALWSNECFELWLLLNFINMHSAISREEYIVKLEKYLQEKYRKNDKNIFGKIMLKNGSIEKAISYAKSLIDIENKTPSNNNPATNVYRFFEHYSKYLRIWT